jgi:UDP-N-acetyl-D-galactosamine dehydrogenase
VQVQVHDPCAHDAEAFEEYGVHLSPAGALVPAQAVVLAVPHRQYLAGGWHGITHHLDQRRGVVMDVKGKLDRATCPDGVLLWRL